ncbi:MAG: hypothetical protein AAF772_06565 [Acidobacteriota bacterium]
MDAYGSTLLVFGLSLAILLLIHRQIAVGWRPNGRALRYVTAFKLSRGVHAALLALLGAIALVRYHDRWPRAFLDPWTGDPVERWIVAFFLAHLVADFVWMVVGVRAHDTAPRRDLIVHHLLGVVAITAAFALDTGYAVIAVVLTTEAMPVATGLEALGQSLRRGALIRRARWLRILILLVWRIPLWLLLSAAVIRSLLVGPRGTTWDLAYAIAAAVLVVLITLDVHWTRACWRGLRRPV